MLLEKTSVIAKVFWSFIIAIVLIALATTESNVKEAMNNERNELYQIFGDQHFREIDNRSIATYNVIIEHSGVRLAMEEFAGLHKKAAPTEQEKAFKPIMNYINEKVQSVIWLSRLVIQRISALWHWFPFLLLFAVPLLLDGYLNWKTNRINFTYSSPWMFANSHKAAYWLLYGLTMAIMLPITIAHYVLIGLIIGAFLALSITLRNMPKEI